MEIDWFSAFGWGIAVACLLIWVNKKIKPQHNKTDQPYPSTQVIVNAYGETLETKAPVPGCVADASKLPFPKNRIKKALVYAMQVTTDPKMREHLKTGYLCLADWQEGVGPIDQGLDCSKLNLDTDTKVLAKQALEAIESGKSWLAKVKAEQELLLKELIELGLH